MHQTAGARAVVCALVGALGSAASGSCLRPPVFECGSDDQCLDLGDEARCEPVGYCSTPDPSCESGRRFHEYAGDGLDGQCSDASCGDGEIQEPEECDDGNDVDGDGCNSDCRVSGQELWTATYASPGNGRDRCYSVAVGADGNAAVIGEVTVEGQGQNLWARQYTADGEPGWTWVLDGEGHVDEEGWQIVAEPDGGFLLAGYIANAEYDHDAWMGKIGSDGILQWSAQYDGGESYLDQARGITRTAEGDIIAIGYATPFRDYETDLWFQRRSADGQTIRWTQHRDGFGLNAQDRAHGITAVPGGYVGVGFRQTEAQTQHAWIEHFDGQGNEIWTIQDDMNGPQSVWTAVAPHPEGGVLLAGWRDSAAGDTDMWLQRRGPAGDLVWEETVASPGGDDDKANALAVDEAGGFIVGGEMGAGAGSTDAWIRRYAPDRTEVWTITYSGPAGDRDTTWGLALAPDGSIFACGYQSTPGTEWDLWVRRFTP